MPRPKSDLIKITIRLPEGMVADATAEAVRLGLYDERGNPNRSEVLRRWIADRKPTETSA